jgi:hypothetical protein
MDVRRNTANLNRLLATFPTFGSGDARTALQVYHETIKGFDANDIEAVVNDFVAGRVEGQSLTFLPPAPQLAAELRKRRDHRASLNHWHDQAVKQIAARAETKEHDEPTRLEIVQAALRRSSLFEPETVDPVRAAEEKAKVAERMRKHDELFIAQDPRPLEERLRLNKHGDE